MGSRRNLSLIHARLPHCLPAYLRRSGGGERGVQESRPRSSLQQDNPWDSRKSELFGWVKEGMGIAAVNRQPLYLDTLRSENLAPPLSRRVPVCVLYPVYTRNHTWSTHEAHAELASFMNVCNIHHYQASSKSAQRVLLVGCFKFALSLL